MMLSMSANAKLYTAIVAICLLAPACIKRYNWRVDGEALRQQTAAWKPNQRYRPDVEQGLSILASTEPAEVNYLRQRGFPVVFVPGVPGRLGDTTAQGVIELPERFAKRPAQIAVVLSHELIHEQRHDPFTRPAEYSVLRRVFWHGEEEEAHNKDLWVAIKLWRKHHDVWGVLGCQWLFEPAFYLLVGPIAAFALTYLAKLAYELLNHLRSWLSKRHMQQTA